MIRIGRISHKLIVMCGGNVSGWILLNGGGFITGSSSLRGGGIMSCCFESAWMYFMLDLLC